MLLMNQMLGFGSGASGSIVQSIQAFSITAATGQNNQTATITAVDTTRSIIIHNGCISAAADDGDFNTNVWNKLVLTNATTVTCTTDSVPADTKTVKGYVIEFKVGVVQSLQSGEITIVQSASGATSGTATISAVTVANSVVISAGGTSAYINSASQNEALTALTLTNTTTVTATRGSNGGNAYAAIARYQVIEFVPGIIESRNAVSNNISAVGSTDTTITAVNLNKTVLFNAGSRTGSNSASTRVASLLVNATTARGIVGGTGNAESVGNAQVIEFSRGIQSIQSGSITIATSTASNTATITSVDTARSVVILSGVTAATSTEAASTSCAHIVLTNATTVTATRDASSASQAITAYFMVVNFIV